MDKWIDADGTALGITLAGRALGATAGRPVGQATPPHSTGQNGKLLPFWAADRLRARARRGLITSRKGNRGELLVQLLAGLVADLGGR